jgi:hypothetical protein
MRAPFAPIDRTILSAEGKPGHFAAWRGGITLFLPKTPGTLTDTF